MPLPLFELDEWFAAAEGRFDLSLSHSGCEPRDVGALLNERELAEFRRVSLGYGAFDGLPELRLAVARTYERIAADDVLTVNGPSEAIYTFMRGALRAKDRVVVQAQLFQSLHQIAREIGCDVVEWRPSDETGCSFRVDDLEPLCRQPTRAIVINFPHNPSGRMVTADELGRIVDLARSAGAWLFSDEAFRRLELPPTPTLPAVCDLYERGVSVSGLSKPFGLGGLRIGWLATRDAPLRAAMRRYRFYTCEMTNTPCQWLACRALARGEEIIGAHRRLIAGNLAQLEEFTHRWSGLLQLIPPQAGTMALVAQRTPLTSTELCQRLLDEQRLLLIPSRLVGLPDRLLRFGLGTSQTEAGLQRLDRFLQTFFPTGGRT